MPDIDLEPQEYTVKGEKEPILHPHWKAGVLAIVLLFAFAVVYRLYIAPAGHGFFDWLESLLSRH